MLGRVVLIAHDEDGHGPPFKERMHRINSSSVPDFHRPAEGYKVTVYHTMIDEVRHYQQHWWECERCKKTIKRANNRKPQEADCLTRNGDACNHPKCGYHVHLRTCGGNFIKIREPERKPKASLKAKNGQSSSDTRPGALKAGDTGHGMRKLNELFTSQTSQPCCSRHNTSASSSHGRTIPEASGPAVGPVELVSDSDDECMDRKPVVVGSKRGLEDGDGMGMGLGQGRSAKVGRTTQVGRIAQSSGSTGSAAAGVVDLTSDLEGSESRDTEAAGLLCNPRCDPRTGAGQGARHSSGGASAIADGMKELTVAGKRGRGEDGAQLLGQDTEQQFAGTGGCYGTTVDGKENQLLAANVGTNGLADRPPKVPRVSVQQTSTRHATATGAAAATRQMSNTGRRQPSSSTMGRGLGVPDDEEEVVVVEPDGGEFADRPGRAGDASEPVKHCREPIAMASGENGIGTVGDDPARAVAGSAHSGQERLSEGSVAGAMDTDEDDAAAAERRSKRELCAAAAERRRAALASQEGVREGGLGQDTLVDEPVL